MMGSRQVAQGALFYEFSIEAFVPQDHLMRGIDRFLDLTDVRPLLAPFYSSHGRPSIDPELMIRMLLLGYCMGIRSERRLCEEVHVNLAYRWFCRLDLADAVPDHSTFSKNRHGRFRESGLFRHLFETVLQRCIDEGLVGGHSFGVDASLIPANANQTRGIESKEGLPPELSARVIDEYLETLDDAAFGASTKVIPKYISPADPAARWTGADGGAAFFAYSTNYMVDLDNAVIVDVEPSVPIRTAEAFAARRMIDRITDRFDMTPDKLVGDTGYGSAEMLGWLVEERGIAPHIPVWDKSKRTDGTFSREDFIYDTATDSYTCPSGKRLQTYRRNFSKPRKANGGKDGFIRYRASKHDCDACPLKPQCCPKDNGRRLMRSVHEASRDVARDIRKTDAYVTSFIQRRKVEMLFAHLKRYIGIATMRLRGPKGAYEQFQLAATAQNLRKLAKLVPEASPA
ncbi:transposase [Flavimaricola marinus]|uniref:Transposase DDE domain protein n=1 Tax=Flavimaricola marinus TaxID=1819565 RepID=A0A238LLJ2_9RHOB|nr:transposase [Flavimaricola marinus]SMY10413.1 Transposase DDE domain protein [Flavimaricola marinus]